MKWSVVFVCLLSCTTGTAIAAAESQQVTAEALFDEARRLMAEERYEEAAQKLSASQELDPALGTMLNLAECYERLGRVASAWAEYRAISALATQTGAQERGSFAEQKSQQLEPQLSKLVIRVDPRVEVVGLRVTRNGDAVGSAELGVPIPVDPGTYIIEASQAGMRPWSSTVRVGSNADSQQVVIPRLTPAPTATRASTSAAPARVAATASAPVQTPMEPPVDAAERPRTLAWVSGGLGATGIAVGSVFGLWARSTWSKAKAECDPYPDHCTKRGVQLESEARGRATVATVGFAAGAVLLAGGVWLWWSGEAAEVSHVSLRLQPQRVSIQGHF